MFATTPGPRPGVVAACAGAGALALAITIPQPRSNTMSDIQLVNNLVTSVSLQGRNAAGNPIPIPAGSALSASSGKPASLDAAITGPDAQGGWWLQLTPLVQVSPGITVTVSGGAGVTSQSRVYDVVSDPAVLAALNIVDLQTRTAPQPVPAAPGP